LDATKAEGADPIINHQTVDLVMLSDDADDTVLNELDDSIFEGDLSAKVI